MSNGHTPEQRAAMSAAAKQAWADGKFTRTATHNANIQQAVADYWQRHFRDRVLSKVDMSGGPTACWLWTGTKDTKGYGRAKHKGKVVKAHRVVYEFLTGQAVTEGKMLLHHCAPSPDNPACCNPAHLREGTNADNMQDAVDKGQLRRGMTHPGRKLTDEERSEVVKRYLTGERVNDIAHAYGISRMLVWRIAKLYAGTHATGR